MLVLILVLALLGGAALLLFTVILRKGGLANLSLAILLIGLAIGVWYTAIRSPLPL